jgi:hypothetical protein
MALAIPADPRQVAAILPTVRVRKVEQRPAAIPRQRVARNLLAVHHRRQLAWTTNTRMAWANWGVTVPPLVAILLSRSAAARTRRVAPSPSGRSSSRTGNPFPSDLIGRRPVRRACWRPVRRACWRPERSSDIWFLCGLGPRPQTKSFGGRSSSRTGNPFPPNLIGRRPVRRACWRPERSSDIWFLCGLGPLPQTKHLAQNSTHSRRLLVPKDR